MCVPKQLGSDTMTTTPKAEGEAKAATWRHLFSQRTKNADGTNLVERERYGESGEGIGWNQCR